MTTRQGQRGPGNSPLHQAVLQVKATDQRRWTSAVWTVPEKEMIFMAELHRLVAATAVLEWIQPLRGGESRPPTFDSFDLAFFEDPGQSPTLVESLKESRFSAVDLSTVSDEVWERLSVFRSEASRAGHAVARRPAAIWRLPVEKPSGELAQRLSAVCRQAEKALGDQVWGQEPGQFSKVFCDHLRQQVQAAIAPTPAGLAMLEDLVVERLEALTWVEPMVFQALCDFMGVVLQNSAGLQVQWSICEVDERISLAPPPVLRFRKPGGQWAVVEIGLAVGERIACPWRAQENRRLVDLYEELRRRS